MSVERARAELDGLDAQVSTLKRRIVEIDQRASQLRTYLLIAQEYGERGNLADAPSPRATPVSAKGVTERAVEASIEMLRAEGKPIHTRILLTRLASQGIAIGGSNPVANLSGFLSRQKSRLRNSRMDGWSLREWDNPHHSTPHTPDAEVDPRDPDLMRDAQIEFEQEALAEQESHTAE